MNNMIVSMKVSMGVRMEIFIDDMKVIDVYCCYCIFGLFGYIWDFFCMNYFFWWN